MGYELEREGQVDFYERFLPRIDPSLNIEDIIADDNDGVLNGNLIEFKLNVSSLDPVLFQCVKYLSALRIKGRPVPANIVIVSLNGGKAWLYHSGDYLPDIEKVYSGAASKGNEGFAGGPAVRKFDYEKNPADAEALIRVLREDGHTRIHIDENCIVGWATEYYKAVPTARKEDFIGDDTGKHKTIGEIRKPHVFEDYIYPYDGESNVRFGYLMDKLNDFMQKKDLGAFYTPEPYARKSAELVQAAVGRVPEGNDYIILDRCAGTGGLESALIGLKDRDGSELISHCVVSTVEYYEYKVLQEVLGAKVRHIIPPVEAADTFNAGLVTGADALTRGYIENPVIKGYVDDPKCTIILYENPPYAETTSLEHQRTGSGAKSSAWKGGYVVSEMRKEIKGAATNDLGNAFIWSAFHFYLRQPTDSYIVYSPVKYWKAQHLISKRFIKGFAFNRRHFHTNIDACIMCALWSDEDAGIDQVMLDGYDIRKDGRLSEKAILPVKKVHSLFSEKYYDKAPFADCSYDGILTGLDGSEAKADVKKRIRPLYSGEMLGYMVADSVGFDNPDAKSSLLVAGRYNGNGFYLHKDNYLEKLPMFCASRYITYNRGWTERARIMKSADGADRYMRDVRAGRLDGFLLKCLLFTCLEMQNHMRTFTGSDGRFYRNELCLDTTNGATVASDAVGALAPDELEQRLLKQWDAVISHAKEADNYNPALTYGVYQIFAELDTSHIDEATGKKAWDNVELHSALQTLKSLVHEYYNKEIVPVLFDYEFLK